MKTLLSTNTFKGTNNDFYKWQSAFFQFCFTKVVASGTRYTVKRVTRSYKLRSQIGDKFFCVSKPNTFIHTPTVNISCVSDVFRFFMHSGADYDKMTVIRTSAKGEVTVYHIVNS